MLDEDDMRNLQEDVILVFPQPITVEDLHKNKIDEEGNKQNNDERDAG